jgi:hypothetical protein
MEKGIGSLMGESGRTMSNMDMMMADQAARQGMSPAEQRMMMIKKTAADMGRTISDNDAKAFGMGMISFEEAMSRAIPMVDMGQVAMERNMMQQEQLGFAAGDEVNIPLSDYDMKSIEIIADMYVDKKGNVLEKPKSEYGLFLISELSNKLGQAKFNKIIADKVNEVKGVKSQDYAEFLSSAPESADLLEEFKSLQSIRGYQDGDEVDVAALPKGLKAMYDSGPKGREGVEKIAAKTDKFAEGGAVESEIDKALEDIQSVQPEAMVIQQVMTMVMEMIASGASEEQIVAALKQMGLDDEDIQQVMMMVASEMQSQDSIDGQLAQMM